MKQAENSFIGVHVIPKSASDTVEDWVKDASGKQWLKVHLTVPPEDGKANRALLKLLAREWDCAPSSLSIISGETSRRKIVRNN